MQILCDADTATPAVRNQENREKKSPSAPWAGAYFTNGPNAAASIAPTLIRHCLPEVQIWRLPNRKPLHLRHSVGVSTVRLRTHWAIKLVVGRVNLEKGRKLQYSFHFRSFTYTYTYTYIEQRCCYFFPSLLFLYNDEHHSTEQ